MHLILASASPRRKELLELVTGLFAIETVDVDERQIEEQMKGRPAEEIAEALAQAKAEAVYQIQKDTDAVVIGADTSVVADNLILGKPIDKEDARNMLTTLSGRCHKVITGVAIKGNNIDVIFHETTEVEFRALDEYQKEMIENYIDTSDPYDKAGAYGIQGQASLLIRRIDGDYFNVVGLPVSRLAFELKKSGVVL